MLYILTFRVPFVVAMKSRMYWWTGPATWCSTFHLQKTHGRWCIRRPNDDGTL